MKYVSVREIKAHFAEFVDASQDTPVVITSHGKPVAVLIGVDGMTLEDLASKDAELKICAKIKDK